MNPPPTAWERLFGWQHALDHPVVVGIVIAIAAVMVLAFAVVIALRIVGRLDDKNWHELIARLVTWCVLIPLIVGPILLGAAWTILAVTVLSLLCYREYARATGAFRYKLLSLIVVLGILAINFTALDHRYGFFVAFGPLIVCILAAAAVLADQPKGYIQRVALAVVGFLFFGLGLGHLSYFANEADYRPILLLLICAVELNDVFAYITGKTLGRRKLCPNTSPNKTLGGALGALILTTTFVAIVGHYVFRGTPMDHAAKLVGLGVIVSVAGQLGDLMLSSIKRDLGIKDIGKALPGHGGLLDRFDSLLLVAPAAFHYIAYVIGGIGNDQTVNVITGSM